MRIFFALSVSLILLVSGCGRGTSGEKRITALPDLNSGSFIIGSMTGTAAMHEARARFPRAEFREYAMPVDAFVAICSQKIDAVVLDRPTLEYMSLAHEELTVMPEDLAIGHISVATAHQNGALMKQINAFLRNYRADGTCQRMADRWFHRRNPEMPELPVPEKSSGLLKVGITANNEPLCFIKAGKLAGFDVEFSLRLAAFLNRRIEFRDLPYDALVPALESGKIDVAVAYMDAMPERAESVLFSENYVDAPISVLIRRQDPVREETGFFFRCHRFFPSLAESLDKTFLREERWKLILQGLGTTLIITFFSVVLGTLMAIPLCMVCRSRRKILSRLAERYISLIMGTPILVLLMILYYVVFAKVDISAVFVAVLAFAMDFSAYTSVTLRSGIESVPPGQMEAALALGHTPIAAFRRFVFPQAVRAVLPVYRGTIISTLKATSIVGYVAIMDLTKMGDIIRSRTYEAFFPLIAIALIYFVAAKCLTALLLIVERRVDPETRRKRLQKRGRND